MSRLFALSSALALAFTLITTDCLSRQNLITFRHAPLEIVTQHGRLQFKVELAETREQQERGLMYRTDMEPDRGMLFSYQQPVISQMWMKNTVLPLDILFINHEGVIRGIAANRTPFSTDIITFPEPVSFVLELLGGTAAQKGIAVGDKMVLRP